MRAPWLLVLVVSCSAPNGARSSLAAGAGPAPLPDLATAYGESLHGFTLGAPALRLADDTFDRARYDEADERLLIEPGGSFTSGWMRWARPFDELLASWNARVPVGVGLTVEVQVASAGGAPSPWLYLGDWGRGRAREERTIEFEHGRVAVDVLRLERPHDRARLRLSALGQVHTPVAVHRTTLCFTDRGLLQDLDAGAPTGAVVARAVPARSQRSEAAELATRVCSPTSVAMVLAAHGVERPTAEVAALIYDADHDIYGNWPRAVQAAFTLGLPGCLVRLSRWPAVEHFLDHGLPLVVSVKAELGELRGAPYPRTSGHLLVLLGFDEDGDVLVNDPAAPSPEGVPRTYRREDLERCWLRRGGVAYALGH